MAVVQAVLLQVLSTKHQGQPHMIIIVNFNWV